jgi:hypothetical protein
MLVVTYSCEHNHPWPAPRNNHHNQNHNAAVASTNAAATKNASQTEPTNSEEEEEEDQKPTNFASQTELVNNSHDDQKFANLGEASLGEYGCNWFSDFECTSSATMLESPLMIEARVTDADMAMVFTMRDDDESFFADLGELPECSSVFRRGLMEREEERRRQHLAPWCGTTG